MSQNRSDAAAPISLLLLEVGSMDARLIGLSLERHMRNKVCLTDNMAKAQVVLVDCDRQGAELALRRIPPQQRLGVVGYALNPRECGTKFPTIDILGKPLNLDGLPAALSRAMASPASIPLLPAQPAGAGPLVAEKTKSLGDSIDTDDGAELCGSLEDLPLAPNSQVPDKFFFDPEDYLIGQLFRAVVKSQASGRPLAVAGLHRLIRVSVAPVPLCLTAFRETRLRPISMTQLPLATTRLVLDPGPDDPSAEVAFASEDLLWNVAVWAARGRLPKDTDPYRVVRLKAWPNFTRVFVPPHALRIAALWVRAFASPVDIASRLAIPQRYVFSFYTAAQFAGLLEHDLGAAKKTSPTASAPPPPPPPQQGRRRSLLGRILRKLLNAV